MKKLAAGLAVILAVSFSGLAFAVDSFTVTAAGDLDADIGGGWAKSFKVLRAAWKADGTGVKANDTIQAIKGWVHLVVTVPGSTAPADNYSLQLVDTVGADILGGAGANRDTANTEQIRPKYGTDNFGPRPVYGPLGFSVSATTNADCNGDVYIYYSEN